MNDSRQTNQFAIQWSEELCDLIMEKAGVDEVEPEVAVYGALAAAVVLARSVGMRDDPISADFKTIIQQEFPESMLNDKG